VLVDPWADLNIGLKTSAAKAASWGMRLLVLLTTALALAGFGLLARALTNKKSSQG
jgi:hypothetical protein